MLSNDCVIDKLSLTRRSPFLKSEVFQVNWWAAKSSFISALNSYCQSGLLMGIIYSPTSRGCISKNQHRGRHEFLKIFIKFKLEGSVDRESVCVLMFHVSFSVRTKQAFYFQLIHCFLSHSQQLSSVKLYLYCVFLFRLIHEYTSPIIPRVIKLQ